MVKNPASFEYLDIILASGSPRRQMLMKEAGINFRVILRDVDETFPPELHYKDVAEYLAVKKAGAYNDLLKNNTIVITADTLVFLKEQIVNKPSDFIEATDMLKLLSGSTHDVVTGVCISSATKKDVFHVLTKVYFRELEDEEIYFYIEKYKPYDKAGSYGAQDWIGLTGIEKIEGSYFNVMGLPVMQLYQHLKSF